MQLSRLGIVAIDGWMALSFLLAWAWPWSSGPFTATAMAFVLVLEFITIHASGIFLNTVMRPNLNAVLRILLTLLIGTAYTAPLVSLAYNYGIWWPAAAMVMLVYDKLEFTLRVMRSPRDIGVALRKFAAIEWALRFFLFMLAGLLAIALPWPPLGAATEDLAAGGSDRLDDYILLVHGTVYFTLSVLVRYWTVPHLREHVGI